MQKIPEMTTRTTERLKTHREGAAAAIQIEIEEADISSELSDMSANEAQVNDIGLEFYSRDSFSKGQIDRRFTGPKRGMAILDIPVNTGDED